jgi:LAO/AO transport system kinase
VRRSQLNLFPCSFPPNGRAPSSSPAERVLHNTPTMNRNQCLSTIYPILRHRALITSSIGPYNCVFGSRRCVDEDGSHLTSNPTHYVPRQHVFNRRRFATIPPETSASASAYSYLQSLKSLTKEEENTIESLADDILYRSDRSNDNSTEDDRRMQQRIALSKAITLVESKSPKRRLMADVLLDRLRQSTISTARDDVSSTTSSFRLGVAGPPGVGKSTFVEALGLYILGLKDEVANSSFTPDKLAVLCIDPSSHVTGGSILGDKTRMSNLSYHPRAYVRPSPSSGTLGGLGSYTSDAVSLCEFAGYNLTIVETVGVGQNEVELAECCDIFLLLLAPGGGDELQGSKKGIVEVADVLVVNKDDGDLQVTARRTASEYKKAIGLLRKPVGWWGGAKQDNQAECSEEQSNNHGPPSAPPVLLISAKTGVGIPELWDTIVRYQSYAHLSGYLVEKRRLQSRYWMWKYLREIVYETAKKDERVSKRVSAIERDLDNGLVAPRVAAGELWRSLVGSVDSNKDC